MLKTRSTTTASAITHSHANRDFLKYRKMPAFGGLIFRPFGLWNEAFGFQRPFRGGRLRPKNRVSWETETHVRETRSECDGTARQDRLGRKRRASKRPWGYQFPQSVERSRSQHVDDGRVEKRPLG
jgi:hypothetical protein